MAAAAAESGDAEEAKRVQKLGHALILTENGGGWVYEDDQGTTKEDRYVFHFSLEGDTVAVRCTDGGADCGNSIAIGVDARCSSDLTLKEDATSYDLTLDAAEQPLRTILGRWPRPTAASARSQ